MTRDRPDFAVDWWEPSLQGAPRSRDADCARFAVVLSLFKKRARTGCWLAPAIPVQEMSTGGSRGSQVPSPLPERRGLIE